MKTIVINEKSMYIPVVNVADDRDLGGSSIPLFSRKDLHFKYLVINKNDDEEFPEQVLAERKDILSWNAYAITLERETPFLTADDIQLSGADYTDMIGCAVNTEAGLPVGNVTSIDVDHETGRILSMVVENGSFSHTLAGEQVLSIDEYDNIMIRVGQKKKEEPVVEAKPQPEITQAEKVAERPENITEDVKPDIKQTLVGILEFLESLDLKKKSNEAVSAILHNDAEEPVAKEEPVQMVEKVAPLAKAPEEEAVVFGDFTKVEEDSVPVLDLEEDFQSSVDPLPELIFDDPAPCHEEAENQQETGISQEQMELIMSRLTNIENLLREMKAEQQVETLETVEPVTMPDHLDMTDLRAIKMEEDPEEEPISLEINNLEAVLHETDEEKDRKEAHIEIVKPEELVLETEAEAQPEPETFGASETLKTLGTLEILKTPETVEAVEAVEPVVANEPVEEELPLNIPGKVEKLTLQSRPAAMDVKTADSKNRIRLEALDDIFGSEVKATKPAFVAEAGPAIKMGNLPEMDMPEMSVKTQVIPEKKPTAVKKEAIADFAAFQNVAAPAVEAPQPAVQKTSKSIFSPKAGKKEAKPQFTGQKGQIYRKNSISQIVGMVIFATTVASLSFLHIL